MLTPKDIARVLFANQRSSRKAAKRLLLTLNGGHGRAEELDQLLSTPLTPEVRTELGKLSAMLDKQMAVVRPTATAPRVATGTQFATYTAYPFAALAECRAGEVVALYWLGDRPDPETAAQIMAEIRGAL